MPLMDSSLHTVDGQVTHTWSMTVSPDRVWWGLTDAEALPCWLGKLTSGAFGVGNVVTIEHAEDYSCASRIQVYEPGQLLSMTWEFPDEPTSEVRISLTQDGASTRLTLQHLGLGSEAANYLTGWHTHLFYLEALLLDEPRPMGDFWSTYDALRRA
ncbi:hypothetical protein GCM10027403_11590 [Arthrobacter tecti]